MSDSTYWHSLWQAVQNDLWKAEDKLTELRNKLAEAEKQLAIKDAIIERLVK